jgi:hypothetical protein
MFLDTWEITFTVSMRYYLKRADLQSDLLCLKSTQVDLTHILIRRNMVPIMTPFVQGLSIDAGD